MITALGLSALELDLQWTLRPGPTRRLVLRLSGPWHRPPVRHLLEQMVIARFGQGTIEIDWRAEPRATAIELALMADQTTLHSMQLPIDPPLYAIGSKREAWAGLCALRRAQAQASLQS